MDSIQTEVQIIIVAFQLTLYAFLIFVNIYKLVKSFQNQAKFLFLFYLLTFLDCVIYLGMMIYQLVILVEEKQIKLVIVIVINIYSIIVESCLLFLLSFYWKQTETLLRGSGLEFQQSAINVQNQLKIKAVCVMLWFLMFTGYIMYTFIEQVYYNELNEDLIYYAGQGISTLILIWSSFSQVVNAKSLSSTLKKFQSLISFSMNRTKFRCMYWVATSINFIRLAYLITFTVLLRIFTQSDSIKWLATIIYTATGIVPLVIYLYSFQINPKQSKQARSFNEESSREINYENFSGLYKPPNINTSYTNQKNKRKNDRESFAQTELSNSYDSKRAI